MSNQSARNYGIDLLRIISMMLVIVMHVFVHGGVRSSATPFSLQYYTSWFIGIISYCAVNIFVIISGYVGVNSNHSYSNIIILWLRVLLYSVIISLIFYFVVPDSIGVKGIIKSLFPLLTNQYWFFTCYFVLFLFMPMINNFINIVEKEKSFALLCVAIISFSILSTITMNTNAFFLNDGFSVLWFFVLYYIGAYISKYKVFKNIKTIILVVFVILSIAFTWTIKLVLEIGTNAIFGVLKYGNIFIGYLSPTLLLTSVFLVLIFSRVNLHKVSVIVVKFLSPLAFSVYLIHDHPLIREYLFNDKLVWMLDYPSIITCFMIVGVGIVVYLLCSIIDIPREYLFKLFKIKQKIISNEEKTKKYLKVKLNRKN